MNRARNTMQGVAMVEFAIVLWLLLMLLLGFIELGRALYQHNTLHETLAVGPRYLARAPGIVNMNSGANSCSWSGAASAQTKATNLIVYGDLNDTGNPVLEGFETDDITILDPTYHDEGSGSTYFEACVIRVEADVDFSPLFGDLIPTPVTLGAAAEERYIGE